MYKFRTMTTLLLAGLSLALLNGCNQDSPSTQYREITGTVESINESTGEVTVTYFNKKKNKKDQVTGTLAADAEIMIDGKTATLDDIRVDDQATITALVKIDGGSFECVAKKVQIDRSSSMSLSASTQSADTAPAEDTGSAAP